MKLTTEQRLAEGAKLRDMIIMIAGDDEIPLPRTVIASLDKGAEAGDLRGLREALRSAVQSAETCCTPDMLADLDRRLRERFGRGLREENEQVHQLIERVRRRGAIRTEAEYRTIDEYNGKAVQSSSGDPALYAELENLMADYVGKVYARQSRGATTESS